MKFRDIISLEVENYSCRTHRFTEYTLHAKCEPGLLVQFLAFNGVGHGGPGQVVHITDWESIPPSVLSDIRQTTFTSFGSVLSGKNKPEGDGTYILKSIGVEVTVKDGMISFPDPKDVKKKATDLQKKKVF